VSEAPPDDPARLFAHGFSAWKKPFVRQFFAHSSVRFVRRGSEVPAGATLALWGRAPIPPGTPPDVAVWRLEDGFLRSVGLGADLVRPLSWVVDRRGLYFDATRSSDLEVLLESAPMPAPLLERAARLRELVVQARLSKYNLRGRPWQRRPDGRRVVLAVGQVEDDASIALGCVDICTNLALVKAARERCPRDWVIFKPHPDVVAGLRLPGRDEVEIRSHCDEIVTDVALPDLLGQVDELHTLTSLSGFEALLRGVAVVCHGLPFYAGWGLTSDRHAVPRRSRRLSLDELVAGTLMLYPRYLSRQTGERVSAEFAVEDLIAWRATTASDDGVGPLRRALRPAVAATVRARRR
jgi:capsular polysaccharide export protein